VFSRGFFFALDERFEIEGGAIAIFEGIGPQSI